MDLYKEPKKEENEDDIIDREEAEDAKLKAEAAEAKARELEGLDSEKDGGQEKVEKAESEKLNFSEKSHKSDLDIEKEIAEKGYYNTVEEICGRERYDMKLRVPYKRFINCFDNEEDELTKKIIANGSRRLNREMDVSCILKKLRNQEIAMSYLLTTKQKYLLRFNDKHVIDSESDYVTLESA